MLQFYQSDCAPNDSNLRGPDDWMAEFIERRRAPKAQLSPPRCSPAKHADAGSSTNRTQPEPAGAPDRADTHRIRIPRLPAETPRKTTAPTGFPPTSQTHRPRHDPACRTPVSRIYIHATRRRSLPSTPQSPPPPPASGPYAAQPTQRTRCRPTASPSAPAGRWRRRRPPRADGNAACPRRRSARPPRAPA